MDALAVVAWLAVAAVVAVTIAFAARERAWRETTSSLQREVAALRAGAREHEQMASVGQAVSDLAQELKSPLQGVIGNAELMMASGELGTESTIDLREIQDSAVRAAGIVRNLLTFTDTALLKRRWHDVNELVERGIAWQRHELDAAGVRVQFVRAERLPLLYVDGRQIEKVIATLLSRPSSSPALEGTRPAAREHVEPAVVTLATRRTDLHDRLIIEIDDGAAVEDSDAARSSGELAACRQVLQAHGGTLEVGQPIHGGARFHLELPVTAIGAETTVGA